MRILRTLAQGLIMLAGLGVALWPAMIGVIDLIAWFATGHTAIVPVYDTSRMSLTVFWPLTMSLPCIFTAVCLADALG